MERYEIDTELRIAHFVAQCAHESELFSVSEENLNYRAETIARTWPARFYLPPDQPGRRRNALDYAHVPFKLANVVYADRMGNGDEGSGDGWKYRGRGFLQITGRENYAAFAGAHPTMPAITYPDVVASAEGAAWSAAWYWHRAGCSAAADANSVYGLTQKINGGVIGIAERIRLTARVMGAFGLPA